MQEFELKESRNIKEGIKEATEQYEKIADELFQLKRLITATRQGLDSNDIIDAPLLKRIQKCIQSNKIEDLEYEKT